MKIKRYFYALVSILAGLATCYLIIVSEVMYAVIACAVALLFTMLFFTSLFESRNPYEAKIKKILKTYDSILVEIECIPKISDKKVIKTKYFKDLVNVQFEIRKPIYYLRKALFCDFVAMTNDTVYVYTLKKDKNYQSEIERIMEEKENSKIEKNVNVKLKLENEKIKKENAEIKKENLEVRKENAEVKKENEVIRFEKENLEQNYPEQYYEYNTDDYYQDDTMYNNGYVEQEYYQNNDAQVSYPDNYYQNNDTQVSYPDNYYQNNSDNIQSNLPNYDDLDRRIEELKKELNKNNNN